MERFNIKCPIAGQEQDLQFDKKAMPGEDRLCFMISAGGCFKGNLSRQKNGTYQPIGTRYYTAQDLEVIGEHLRKQIR